MERVYFQIEELRKGQTHLRIVPSEGREFIVCQAVKAGEYRVCSGTSNPVWPKPEMYGRIKLNVVSYKNDCNITQFLL